MKSKVIAGDKFAASIGARLDALAAEFSRIDVLSRSAPNDVTKRYIRAARRRSMT